MSIISNFFSGFVSGVVGGGASMAEIAGVDLTPSAEAQQAIMAANSFPRNCDDGMGRGITQSDVATFIPPVIEHLITPHPVVHVEYHPSNDMV